MDFDSTVLIIVSARAGKCQANVAPHLRIPRYDDPARGLDVPGDGQKQATEECRLSVVGFGAPSQLDHRP